MTSDNKTMEGCANLYPAIPFLKFTASYRFKALNRRLARCLANGGPLGSDSR